MASRLLRFVTVRVIWSAPSPPSHAVQYMLIGGVAALLHGARRPTLDPDLLPGSDHENLNPRPPDL